MSTWHVWSMEWSTDGDGAQSIGWRIDDTLVGETTLVTPFEALTLTFWNDNQFPTLLENGQFSVVMHNPGSPQNFDIDWVEIYQSQDWLVNETLSFRVEDVAGYPQDRWPSRTHSKCGASKIFG